MNVNKYKLLTFLIAFFAAGIVIAQIRPVRVSVQLVPPYSGYLPDYADPAAEKLKVVLQFNDFSQAQYQVKLKFEIKGNGFALTNKAFINVPPITLIPGQPVLLSGSDLAPYLSSNNLDFTGLNQSQYEQRMALPEGNYQICVTAYDYYNNQIAKLSEEACAQAWFTLSNPPLLNLPLCNSVITPQTPQNLIFQWTPLNLGSPLSASTTEYEFALWECRPDSFVNENQLVLSTAPVYSIVTQQTYLNYSLAEPPLNVYMKYVWRVRAKDISGRDLFINNGKSEICTFYYGQPNNVLGDALNLNVTAQGLSQFSGKCNFNTQSAFTNYQVNMRKVGTNNWFISYTNTGTKSFHNLEGSKVYECRVRGYDPIQGNWSNIATFTTNPPPLAGCNDAAPNIPPSNIPLPPDRAVPGLKVQTTQYVLRVKSIEALPNPGWFKGSGYVNTFGMPLPVEFDAIFIDENSIHQQGIIRAKTTGLDEWLAESDLETASNNATYVNGTLTNVTINGNQYCYTTQQNPTPICVAIDTTKKITVIRDEAGNQYVINTGPPPTVTGPTSYLTISSDNLAASDSLKVVFAAAANQAFGFDSKVYAAFTNDYELIKLSNNSNYFVPNKSIGDNATDRAIANFTINNLVEANLVFKTKGGTVLNKTKASGLNTYTINGITAGAECVYAYYNNQKIGKLNIISLNKISKKVVLVPVNGAGNSITQQQLNNVYKQANTNFTLSTAPNFTFDLGTDGLEAADATLLKKYSPEMRALRDAYKQKDSLYDKNAYYIFVVPNFSNPSVKGYMARGRAVGFISSNATATDLAHELGHGAFKLEHTFDAIAKGTSNNLMDYNGGTHLVKSQWQNIQNPTTKITWFDEEEDGSAVIVCSKTVCATCPSGWDDLIQFDPNKNSTVYANVTNRAKVDDPLAIFRWHILPICAARGKQVNLDYYSIKIKTTPKINNVRWSAGFLFEFVRKNLNLFLPDTVASFASYSNSDKTTWNSSTPLTSAMTFHIPIKGPLYDDASVMCTSYTINQPAGNPLIEASWIFSPIQTPNDHQHPVSGNRQFGIKQNGNYYEFYIRGADRLTGTMDQLLGTINNTAFNGADDLWKGFQSKLINFINRNGGEAEVDNTKYHWARYTW